MCAARAPSEQKVPETAGRLEHVRKELGFSTLKDFWRAVVEEGEYEPSYPAVRTWHTNREPPAHYLGRVSKVFGIHLEWLLHAEGELFERIEVQQAEAEFGVGRVGSVLPPYLNWVPQSLLGRVLETAREVAACWPVEEQPPGGKALRQLSELMHRPFDFLPFKPAALERDPSKPVDPAYVRYVEAMLLAVNLAALVEPVRQGEAAD